MVTVRLVSCGSLTVTLLTRTDKRLPSAEGSQQDASSQPVSPIKLSCGVLTCGYYC